MNSISGGTKIVEQLYIEGIQTIFASNNTKTFFHPLSILNWGNTCSLISEEASKIAFQELGSFLIIFSIKFGKGLKSYEVQEIVKFIIEN